MSDPAKPETPPAPAPEAPLTPEEAKLVAAARAEWERPAKERRAARAARLDALRLELSGQLVIANSAALAAFQQGDHCMLDAAQEEALRVLDLIRLARLVSPQRFVSPPTAPPLPVVDGSAIDECGHQDLTPRQETKP